GIAVDGDRVQDGRQRTERTAQGDCLGNARGDDKVNPVDGRAGRVQRVNGVTQRGTPEVVEVAGHHEGGRHAPILQTFDTRTAELTEPLPAAGSSWARPFAKATPPGRPHPVSLVWNLRERKGGK